MHDFACFYVKTYYYIIPSHQRSHKGQLILKCPFGVFKSTKKQQNLASKKRLNKKNKGIFSII